MPYFHDSEEPQARTDAEAAAAAATIAGLRWRLRRQSTFEHPAVRLELLQLDEQLTAQMDRAVQQPGKHRCTASRLSSRSEPGPGEDAGQPRLRPGPAAARIPAGHAPAGRAQPALAPVLQLVPGT